MMQLTNVALALATLASMANAYLITTDDVNCRSGPSTSDDVVETYAKGTDVQLECQTLGETISGNYLWDKTSDGCYVTDYYVKTGSDSMVVDSCEGGSGSADNSTYEGPITRKQIMTRGQFWVDKHVPYSMAGSYPDLQGRSYRTDCSGFVSMALHAMSQGYSTVTLPEIADELDWEDLKEGDFVGTLGDGTAFASGHVVLFHSWVDDSHEEFNTLECRGTYGCVAYKREINFPVDSFTAKPYRYKLLRE